MVNGVATVTAQRLSTAIPIPTGMPLGGWMSRTGIWLGRYANPFVFLATTMAGDRALPRERPEFTTIFKAPATEQMKNNMMNNGFLQEYFSSGDRSIYFAGPSSRFVAEDYARNWRQGIIQVTIPSKEYIKYFKMYERPHIGDIGGVELQIPIKAGVRLSTYPRFLTPY